MTADPIAQRTSVRRLAFALAGIVLLAWIMLWRADQFGGPRSAALLEMTGPAMGTTFTVKLVAAPGSGFDETGVKALVQESLDRVDLLMSTYRPDSEVSRFNAATSTDPSPIAPETAEVLACALKVSEQTVGAFDVTIAPIVNAYGFGPDGRPAAMPADTELEALRAKVGYTKLDLNPDVPSLRKVDPAITLDLNSIAPGFAADLIGEKLEASGVSNYMVEVGGEIRARGTNAQGEPWRAGIEKPAEGERTIHRTLPLDGVSLATSGDYRDFYMHDGVRISHTIDARTGRPVTHNLASVSVVHADCMWADAYATAIMALGPDDGFLLAKILDLPALLITREADGAFVERATPAFEKRFGALEAQP
jgi:thiamine biosynthesis lipoprotein